MKVKSLSSENSNLALEYCDIIVILMNAVPVVHPRQAPQGVLGHYGCIGAF